MIDIVERLRAEVDPDVNEPLDRLLDEAADEIQRLRLALMEIDSIAVGKKAGAALHMQSTAREALSQAWPKPDLTLREEVERLREIVRKCGGLAPDAPPKPSPTPTAWLCAGPVETIVTQDKDFVRNFMDKSNAWRVTPLYMRSVLGEAEAI